jgi:hypothetical protein
VADRAGLDARGHWASYTDPPQRNRAYKIGLALLTLCSLPCSVVAGGVPGPVCKREEVVQYVTNSIQGSAFNAILDHRTIAEVPTSTPNVVLCYAWVRITFYDSPRFGPLPLTAYQTREYSVRKLVNGFEVAISPPQGPFP